MSTNDFAPIPSKTAGDLLSLLGELRAMPTYRSRADALCVELGEALAIARDHRSHFEMMCMELLEATGRATGRQISTMATRENVKIALDALDHTVPVLGGSVIELPRVPERETQRSIDSAVSRAMLDMLAPITMRVFAELRQRPGQPSHEEYAPVNVWSVPRVGEVWCSAIVRAVEYDSPNTVRLIVRQLPPEGGPF